MPIITPSGSSGGGGSSSDVPIADPTGIRVDTTTYNNPLSGSGKLTTLVFPGYTTGIAFAVEGDAFPRLLIGSENDMYAADGTVDSYNISGGGLIFKFGAGVDTRVGFNSTYWGAQRDGLEFFSGVNVSAPDDANVANGERVQWFDATNGAPALRFKQRTADGTLTSGRAASLNTGGTAFTGVTKPTVTGALSTVADAPAKAVLTSIIAALTTLGLATDGTT